MFDVLMYLFETYVQSELDFMVDQDALTDELTRAGFQNLKYTKRFPGLKIWLRYTIVLMHPEYTACASDSFRIYAAEETLKLSTECRGFFCCFWNRSACLIVKP